MPTLSFVQFRFGHGIPPLTHRVLLDLVPIVGTSPPALARLAPRRHRCQPSVILELALSGDFPARGRFCSNIVATRVIVHACATTPSLGNEDP
eukprot:1431818-Pyramimonas_sp.AAC.1